MPELSPILEAIAITAACKLRWPELRPGQCRLVPTKASCLIVPVPLTDCWPTEVTLAGPQMEFRQETIEVKRLWTGQRNIYLGYGPESDILVHRI